MAVRRILFSLDRPFQIAGQGMKLVVLAEVSDCVVDGDEHPLTQRTASYLNNTASAENQEVLISSA